MTRLLLDLGMTGIKPGPGYLNKKIRANNENIAQQ
jgi:hypothetical protein